MTVALDVDHVREAAASLASAVARTPVLTAAQLDAWAGLPVHAKAEGLQRTGSFKVRGALNRIRTLGDAERDRGLVTVSAGNAALGAAFAARSLGARLTVVMPEDAVAEKRAAVLELGATLVTDGVVDAAAAFVRARQLQADHALTFVHPYDDPMVVAGAATATLELLEDSPPLARVYIPCSGGGLLAGAVLARRAFGSRVELVGVQPTGSDGMVRSLAAGRPVRSPSISTVADGLTAPAPGAVPFGLIAAAGDLRVRTVPDDAILEAMVTATRLLRVVVEPAGAAALAGARADVAEGRTVDGPVGVVLSGSNVSWHLLSRLL
ncbi:threonine ammonia-lyase [Mumia sp. DW29H23]|uniref:threonine ammonia-lyase n=1 Tax=Mumia sp. DW29H23 TaxID=3421241 RepID=UPI003D682B32